MIFKHNYIYLYQVASDNGKEMAESQGLKTGELIIQVKE